MNRPLLMITLAALLFRGGVAPAPGLAQFSSVKRLWSPHWNVTNTRESPMPTLISERFMPCKGKPSRRENSAARRPPYTDSRMPAARSLRCAHFMNALLAAH